ncbi:hypothetical protein BJX61DRAFT_4211 [Aspergillus egyptiacus]|nr:hypothetical protein BJX61DRAFT_4211 [Aspergillus egyptiacus]
MRIQRVGCWLNSGCSNHSLSSPPSSRNLGLNPSSFSLPPFLSSLLFRLLLFLTLLLLSSQLTHHTLPPHHHHHHHHLNPPPTADWCPWPDLYPRSSDFVYLTFLSLLLPVPILPVINKLSYARPLNHLQLFLPTHVGR